MKPTDKEIIEFLRTNRVEILLQDDIQFHCFIDFKEGDKAYGVGLTPYDALENGIYSYNKEITNGK